MLFSHGPNKEFLVPDSCRVTERNGNSIRADFTENIIENDYNDACFSYFQTKWQLFWTFLHCRINTICRQILLYSLLNRPEKFEKGSLYNLFLKIVKINYIFSDNVRILYIYSIEVLNLWHGWVTIQQKLVPCNKTCFTLCVVFWCYNIPGTSANLLIRGSSILFIINILNVLVSMAIPVPWKLLNIWQSTTFMSFAS